MVNIILRQQFTGVTATGTAGTAYNGEGNQYKASITGGIGDLTRDKYNAYVTLDYQKQEAYAMNQGKKYVGTNDLTFMSLADQRAGQPALGFGTGSLNGVVRSVNPTTGALVGGGPYTTLPLTNCDPGLIVNGFCRYDVKDFLDIQPEVERLNVFARGTYNFTPSVQGYAEASYFQVKTQTRNTPSSARANWYDPSTNTIQSSVNIFLPVGHPDNPLNAQNLGGRLYYTDGSLGGRDANYETDTQRYLAGAKGAHWGWDWDVAGLYIKTETDVTRTGFFQYDRLQQGLAGTSPFGYYRVGSATSGLNSQAFRDYMSPSLNYTIKSENTIFDAKASRDLYKLQGGQLALARWLRIPARRVEQSGCAGYRPPATSSGWATPPAFGNRNVNAVFAELYAPVLRNLEITAAVRFDDYSDVGNTTNPKIGVKWTVVPQLVLRGTYATAFRAPGLYETSTANATAGFTTARDPVRCPVTGLTADCNGTVLGINTGNPFIKPETSDTYTAGVIWEPIPGLSGTLDYWNIETKDQITIGSVAAVLANPGGFPAATVGRDTNNLPGIPNSGTVLYVSTPFQNANTVKTDGIDLDIVWRQSLKEWGTLTTQYQWTHIFNYSQTFANGETFKYAGTSGNYDVSSGSGTPEDRMNLIIGWTRGPWNVTGTVKYVSGYDEIPYQGLSTDVNNHGADAGCLGLQYAGTDCTVSSFTTLDLAASYKGFKNWEIFGSVINVFNRIAPYAPAAAYGLINYNYNYAYSGATGTQFNAGVRYTFN